MGQTLPYHPAVATTTAEIVVRPASELQRLRKRTLWSLVAGVALGSIGHIAAVTVAAIVAADIAGGTASSGTPGATVVLGAALGAFVLAPVMVRRGRRFGLALGYTISVTGAVIAGVAVGLASLPDYIGSLSPTLRRVLPDLEGPSFTAYFVYPEELRSSKRVAVFRDFLLRKVAEQPVW